MESSNLPESDFDLSVSCPLNCPNRAKSRLYYVDKGFSYLNALIVLFFYFLVATTYDRRGEEIPLHLTIFALVSILGVLGVKTQSFVEVLGRLLSK